MYWEIYAFVLGGIIKNIAVFEPNGAYTNANMMAKEAYGVSAFAINVTDYPVQIGDTVTDGGEFYHDGEKVEKLITVNDKILELQLAVAELGMIVGG